MKRAALILRAALFISFFTSAFSIEPSKELEKLRLISLAKSKELHKDPYFLKLLYYEKNIFGNFKSRNINTAFFLSKWGGINPQSELNALINGFFYEGEEKNNPQCLFPQRYFWLKRALEISENFPQPQCKDYQEWADQIRPESVSLVFAAGYLNNPSTLYGHTFLLLKKGGGPNSLLLDYTVNYAASTGDEKGLFFALKGLSGLYPGEFTTMPYYLKIQEYSNMENRDLWEYPLIFSPVEKENLTRHLWELGKAAFPYYFFNKNCSWQLIPLLEIVKPQTSLKSGSGLWIIPSDTAKLIVSKAATGNFENRPSLINRLKYKYSSLNNEEKKAFSLLKKGIYDFSLPDKSRARVYETYSDFLELKFQRGKIKKDKFDSLIDPVLSARAKIGPLETFESRPKPKHSPVEGHESFKISFGTAFAKKRHYYELGLRPAFCDLLDDDLGYINNSQLKMGELRLRYDTENDKLFAKQFALAEIISLNPLSGLTRDLSWSVFLGWKEYERNAGKQNKSVFSLRGGPGLSFSENEKNLLFIMADAEVQAGPVLEKGFALGAGPEAGFKLEGKKIKFLFTSSFTSFFYGKEKPVLKSRAETAFNLNKNLSFRLLLEKTPSSQEAGFYIHKFFSPL